MKYLIKYKLVPIILISVACLQIFFAHTQKLAPWRGGGFGMYSTIDSPINRQLVCQALDTSGQLCTVLIKFRGSNLPQTAYLQAVVNALTLPNRFYLNRLAELLLKSDFVSARDITTHYEMSLNQIQIKQQINLADIRHDIAQRPVYRPLLVNENPQHLPHRIRLKAIRLSVHRPRFDPDSGRLTWDQKPLRMWEAGTWD